MHRTRCLVGFVVFSFCAGVAPGAEWSDPTRPDTLEAAVAVQKRQAVYTVSAILMSDRRRIAIVNRQKVRVGDIVDGAKVVAIDRKTVRLEVDGRSIVTAMRGSDD